MPSDEEFRALVLAAIESGRVDEVKLMLHPYLRWTMPDGTEVRGRIKVLDLLRTGYPIDLERARSVEIERRDGQIYRWR